MTTISRNDPEYWQQTAPLGFDPESLTDEDILAAMREISGYLDITPGDLKEVYALAYRHAHTRILSTPAARIMTGSVHFVPEDMPIVEIARLMDQRQVGGVPVVGGKDETVVGMISEKDFMQGMTGGKRSFMGLVADCLGSKGCPALQIRGRTAKDIMTSPAVTVSSDTPALDIFDMMQSKHINRIPVVDKGRLAGIISRDDLLEVFRLVPAGERHGGQQA